MSVIKRMKMTVLHISMYSNVHNDSKMTAFLIQNAQSIRGKCKNRELITSFNHYTCRLAISFNEHQLYHNGMGCFIGQSSLGNDPIPSQFDPENVCCSCI